LYEDEEFTNMLNFNKKILRKKSELLEILGSFYILFKNEEKETQEKLIEEIFSLSQENIQFLYEILISNK
jgi:hypothetical protein